MQPFGTIAGLGFCMAATSALASEVILYDNANCGGEYRVLIDSEPDLDRTDFGNEAASVRVVAGTWTFYRDDNFQSNNGPPVTLSPGGCVNLGVGPTAQFPPELMDSVQLVQPAPGPGAAIMLYADTGLQGSYRVLTGNTPDLDAVDFDNRIESFNVLAGAWRIFRDDGFQSFNGPPLDAVGMVPDIAAAGFPRDRASSVMRLMQASDPVPPPPPELVEVQCPPGSASNGAVCVDCTGSGLQVAPDGGSCQCPPGQQAIGSRTVDGIPVALCQRELAEIAPPAQDPDAFERPSCSGGLVSVGTLSGGGGCVPCPDNSVPNANNTHCVCPSGFQEVGIEGTFGFPICSPESGGRPPAPAAVEHVADAWDAYQAARGGRFAFSASAGGAPLAPNCNITSPDYPNRVTLEFWPVMTPVSSGHCTFELFGDRGLREGWEFVSWTVEELGGAWVAEPCDAYIVDVSRNTPANPRNMSHTVEMHAPAAAVLKEMCLLEVTEIKLRGPAGANWRDAFR